jgi:hypothetical protein
MTGRWALALLALGVLVVSAVPLAWWLDLVSWAVSSLFWSGLFMVMGGLLAVAFEDTDR